MVTKIVNRPQEIIERRGTGYNNLEKLDFKEEEIYEEYEESHPKYKNIVEEVIKNFNPASNNDVILYFEFLRALNLAKIYTKNGFLTIKIDKSKMSRIPSPETATRARRSLNAKGKCLPTDHRVLIRRSKKQKALTKYFRYND